MSRRVKVFFEERKKSIKLSLFFFRELFVNSIQNNPTRYTKRETYRSGVDGEPGASLGGSSGSLEVDLFVRATIIHWRGEERGASVSARSVGLDIERDRREDTRPSFFPPLWNEISKSTQPPPSRVRKKETTTKTRRLRPRVLGRIESREHFRARCVRVFSSRRGKKIHPRVRVVVVVVVVVVGGFSACVIHLFVLVPRKNVPASKKKKRKNPLVVPRFLRRKALSLEVSRPKTRPRCGGKRVGAYLGGELRGSNGGRQRKHFCICGVFVDVFCA